MFEQPAPFLAQWGPHGLRPFVTNVLAIDSIKSQGFVRDYVQTQNLVKGPPRHPVTHTAKMKRRVTKAQPSKPRQANAFCLWQQPLQQTCAHLLTKTKPGSKSPGLAQQVAPRSEL